MLLMHFSQTFSFLFFRKYFQSFLFLKICLFKKLSSRHFIRNIFFVFFFYWFTLFFAFLCKNSRKQKILLYKNVVLFISWTFNWIFSSITESKHWEYSSEKKIFENKKKKGQDGWWKVQFYFWTWGTEVDGRSMGQNCGLFLDIMKSWCYIFKDEVLACQLWK